MLILQDISYIHPNKDLLFEGINLTVKNHDKTALIGNNGTGKSTLLKIIAGEFLPSGGSVKAAAEPYYIPQIFGQFNHLTVAKALRIETKFQALTEILNGNATEYNLTLLNDDWTLEERCNEALAYWQLTDINLNQTLGALSGGQKTKLFLAGISIHQPGLVLMDEPSNHLDAPGRKLLYDFIQSTTRTLVVVSHDRTLLNLLNPICELTQHGIKTYSGNYDFYYSQKQVEIDALSHDIQSREKVLRKAKEKERETTARQQKLNNRGKGKQEKAGMPKGMMDKMKNDAENSTAKLSQAHAEKVNTISQELQNLRSGLSRMDKMKFDFDNSALHTGKILITAKDINIRHGNKALWKQNLSFQITSGDRIALKGPNGLANQRCSG